LQVLGLSNVPSASELFKIQPDLDDALSSFLRLKSTHFFAQHLSSSLLFQVMGLSNVPSAGELFEIRPDLDDARTKAEERGISQRTQRLANMAGEGKITLQSLAAAAAVKEEGLEFGRLNIILKVDVAGSAEAIRSALEVRIHLGDFGELDSSGLGRSWILKELPL
jgi:translation initiation factor IF-2